MATLYELMVKVGLDSGDAEKGIDNLTKKTSSFGEIFKANLASDLVSKAFSTMADGAKKAASGVANLIKQSVTMYSDTEQLRGGVQKLYGSSTDLQKAMKQTGIDWNQFVVDGVNGTDAIADEIAYNLQQAPNDIDGLMDYLENDYNMSAQQAQTAIKTVQDAISGAAKTSESAADLVMKNADQAYKTAGMSANQYMETATQFSASLISSLSGDAYKAAQQTDVAMKAISDNFNTFGGDINSITDAFKGFSKQNYTMLDNLKLGYGGTKEEMERLIDDANTYAESIGQASDLSIDSFSDIVTAIELIQEKQNIAGTTAKEATTTIQGSLGMMKAAWDNLVAGFIDPQADISVLIDEFVETVVGGTDEAGNHINGFVDNIVPALTSAMEGIGLAVEQVAPIVSEKLPELIDTILPSLVSAATSLITALAESLPAIMEVLTPAITELFPVILQAIVDILPSLIETVTQLITDLAGQLPTIINILVESLPEIASAVWDGFTGAFSELSPGAQALIGGILAGVIGKGVLQVIPSLVSFGSAISDIKEKMELSKKVTDTMGPAFSLMGSGILPVIGIIAGVIAAIVAVVEIIKHWGEITEWFGNVWEKVTGFVQDLGGKLGEFFSGLWDGIAGKITSVWEGISGFFSDIWGSISGTASSIWGGVSDTLGGIWDGISGKADDVFTGISGFFSDTWDGISSTASDAWDGISSTVGGIWDDMSGTADDVFTGVSDFLGNTWDNISSDASSTWDSISGTLSGTWNDISSDASDKFDTVKTNIGNAWDNVSSASSSTWSSITGTLGGAWNDISGDATEKFNTIKKNIGDAWDKVSSGTSSTWDKIKSAVQSGGSNVGNAVTSIFNGIRNTIQGVINSAWNWGADIVGNIASGIRGAIGKVTSAVSSVANKIKNVLGFSEPKEGPLSKFHTFMPDMMELAASGIEDNTDLVSDAATKAAQSISDALSSGTYEIEPNANVTGTGANYFGDVNITVYGAEGQDIRELADEIEERITNNVIRRRAAQA